MNLNQLQYLLALDEHRHFGRAAEACKVAQPSLSTMIQKLEEELGTKVFDRKKQPIAPTETGLRILEQARIILQQAEQLKEIVLDAENSLGGTVKVAILPTIAPYLLPRLIPILKEELPSLHIDFIELTTDGCLQALNKGEVELALIASYPNKEGLMSSVLYYEEFFGFVARNHTLYNEECIRSSLVDSEQLWLLDEGHCFRDQLLRFCQLKKSNPTKYTYKNGSLQTFMNMVKMGNGMTFIPELAKDTLSKSSLELVRPFAIPRPVREVQLVIKEDYLRSKLVENLETLIKSCVPETMLSLGDEQRVSN